MVKLRVLAEAIRSFFSKAYTVRYPYEPSPPPETYRGKLVFDAEKCTGCGACVECCPSGALSLIETPDKRVIEVWYGKCTFCARCEEVCPQEAIKLTTEYDLSTYDKEEVKLRVEHSYARCARCGAPISTEKWVDQTLSKIPTEKFPPGYEEVSKLCQRCRQELQARMIFAKRVD